MAHERPRFYQQRNNGVPPPERGGIRFAVSAPPINRPNEDRTTKITRPVEIPLPPVQDQAIKKLVEEALGNSGSVFERPRKTKKNKRLLIASGLGGALALMGGTIWAVDSFTDNDSSPTPQTRSVDSPPSFNDDRLIPRPGAETKKVNPKEIFDNTPTKGIFTEHNSVVMTPEQYRKTSPRLIDGDSVVMPLPIEFPEGQIPNVKFKREKGKMFGGQRLINGRSENGEIISDGAVTVNDVLILDNLPVGSVFLSPWKGEIQLATSSGYENPDGSLKIAAFTIYTTDAKGNKVTLTMSTVKVKPLIEPSRIEYEKGTNHTKPLTREPLNLGDPIVQILTTNHDNPNYDGQIHISALSRVEENGKSRGGAAGIEIATTPEGQSIRLDRKSGSK